MTLNNLTQLIAVCGNELLLKRGCLELDGDVVAVGGTGHRAMAPGVLGGKTGTSNDNRDAWFVGAWRDLVIGVWTGRDDNTSMSSKITGGTIPATIFHEIVK